MAFQFCEELFLPDQFHDPLTINLTRQTRVLRSLIPPASPYATALSNASSTRELIVILSRLLAMPALTHSVATTFRPILLPLCAQWSHDEGNEEDILVALSSLIQPHEELFPILSEVLQRPYFADGPLAFILTSPSLTAVDSTRLHRLLLGYYRILLANREIPQYFLWPLAPLSLLFWTPHPDNGVCLLAIRCYAMQSGMSEAEREKLETDRLGEICGADCNIEYGRDIHGNPKIVDGWMLPAVELKRVVDARNAIISEQHNYYTADLDATQLCQPDLSENVANVHGILLLRTRGPTLGLLPLVHTPTAIQSLRALAIRFSLRLPTLLTSPPSSGKSLLLSELASTLHPGVSNQIITVHLADTSLDPRSLLGAYVSSSTQPGAFEWKEGILVRAMREGKWILFKDIDKGSSEILGIIKPLMESLRVGKWIGGRASLEVPSRGLVRAHANFALWATRSLVSSRNDGYPTPSFSGSEKFHEIIIQSPTADEVQSIIQYRFPHLPSNVAVALIHLWEAVRALDRATPSRNGNLRDLEKFCARVDTLVSAFYRTTDFRWDAAQTSLSVLLPNPTLRESIYCEGHDVFCWAGSSTASARTRMEMISTTVALQLGLDPDRRGEILKGRASQFFIEKDVNGRVAAVCAGPVRLLAVLNDSDVTPSNPRHFVMHRPAVLLVSRIVTALSLGEPVLLTGETATGKTSVVAHLASLLNRRLVSLNLSHQTESSDLIGGFKPVDARLPGSALHEQFLELFGATFSRRKNSAFEESLRKSVLEGRWKRAVGIWREAARLAKERLQARRDETEGMDESSHTGEQTSRKRQKFDSSALGISATSWNAFERQVDEFEVQYIQAKGKFAFGFVEGPLVQALRSGDWVLLDEVNLASSETLECISALLHSPTSSITLAEQGSLEAVPRHPNFRLFACMNPATDVGKKDLPPSIRSRFTEIDVPPADADRETLLAIVTQYIGPWAVGNKAAVMNVVEFYTAVKTLAEQRQVADRSNHTPHYSLRTLVRALTFVADTVSVYGLHRSLWEGFIMAFTMVLDIPSAQAVTTLAEKTLLAGARNPRSILSQEPPAPSSHSPESFVKFGPFYLEKGPLAVDLVDDYIMTPSVEKKLVDLARIILTRRFPVLIEGPTSSGKTSSVEYLARRTGHHFIRINNHEHTDIQEYIGSYVSDPVTGKLIFKDGLLVLALRHGYWIVLDELNLAPTDVLEALNRLLDDNRELVIPETHEVVRPHPYFMLFATQNPPGLYAGRKVLSRAFRNRFIEVHFDDVPQVELEFILSQRCRIAPSYGQRIVNVFRELQKRRQFGRVFESKHSFATLRDLFRWAGRDAVGYQQLAENGYMLLAERARREDDKLVVKEVIEAEMKVQINERALYNLRDTNADYASFLGCPIPSSSQLVWTHALQRLFILVSRALRFNEPVLLVGETGSGKTSVCQLFAESAGKRLRSVNCHQGTETADLIGGLRPVRDRSTIMRELLREVNAILEADGVARLDESSWIASVEHLLTKSENISPQSRTALEDIRHKMQRLGTIFEWRDGPLVEAMRSGDVFLLDEISLADDSVLERLNSVLEPARTIILAERGGTDLNAQTIKALSAFKLLATMNPGGDYGKKELSPALRNRFTEIWVPPIAERSDLSLIVSGLWKFDAFKSYSAPLLDFWEWLCAKVADNSLLGVRDITAWVNFSNAVYHPGDSESMPLSEIFHHAAHMTLLDGLSSQPQLSTYSPQALQSLKAEALLKLQEFVPRDGLTHPFPVFDPQRSIQIGPFAIAKGSGTPVMSAFNLHAATTRDNALRVVRAYQVSKPILLEGSPGVGKTSLITTLANISGHTLCRINLSDQTDLIDLFGSDLPVEGGHPGEFAWKDAEFLKALQDGHWVLLDEMNLASQSVLEGLNAVLDHRGAVYLPELGRTFVRHPEFRIFAAQNPLHQGGGRKGLPKSFVNRFTKVYLDELSDNDLLFICQGLFPDQNVDALRNMIMYNARLNDEVRSNHSFAQDGAPWESNLRDVIRWGTLLCVSSPPQHPADYVRTVYLHRFRSAEDLHRARSLFEEVFSMSAKHLDDIPYTSISSTHLQIGKFRAERSRFTPLARSGCLLQAQFSSLESVALCTSQSWLAIISGPQGCGKSELVRTLASLTGRRLVEISVNSSTDTMDLLGGFEQADSRGRILAIARSVLSLINHECRLMSGSKPRLTKSSKLLRQQLQLPPLSTSVLVILQALTDILAERTQAGEVASDLAHFVKAAQELTLLDSAGSQFVWVDGPLTRAIMDGDWILLDNANACNPSVLDRLNPLCEPDGVIVLSERGLVDGKAQTLKPHPHFRLFMTVEPQYGELSRAMRNRGVEVALFATPTHEDRRRLEHHLRLPVVDLESVNMKSYMINFEVARRGVVVPEGLAPLTSCPWPSGYPLDQHSLLSTLIQHASLFSINPPQSPLQCDSLLHVLARIAAPAYIPYLNRFLSTFQNTFPTAIGQLSDFLQESLSQALSITAPLRAQYCSSIGMPPEFVFAEPLDVFLGCSPCPNCELEIETPSAHLTMLRILDCCVSLFMCDSGTIPPRDIQTAHPGPLAVLGEEYNARAIQETDALRRAILAAARSGLERLDVTASGDLDTIIKLLKYSRPLRSAVTDGSLNYSALQALSGLLSQTLRRHSTQFVHLSSHVNAVLAIASPDCGRGMTEIWSSLMTDVPMRLSPELARLDMESCNLRTTANIYELRKQTFGLMTLLTLPAKPTDDQRSNLTQMAEQVEKHLRTYRKAEHEGVDDFSGYAMILPELEILLGFCSFGGFVSNESEGRIEEVINIACASQTDRLLRLTNYQHVLWAVNVGGATLPIIARCHIEWLYSIWNADPFDNTTKGPQILFLPMHLRATMRVCDRGRKPLSSLKDYEALVHRHVRLTFFLCETPASRTQNLVAILQQSLLMIASCFATSFDKPTTCMLQELTRDPQIGSPSSIERALFLLEKSTNEPFSSSVRRFVRPALRRIAELAPSTRESIANLGMAWLSLSRMLLDLYVPNKPLDPAAVQSCISNLWRQEEATLTSQIYLHHGLEQRSRGNDSNNVIAHLNSCLKDALGQTHTTSLRYPQNRNNLQRLHIFWAEVSQFLTQVIPPSRIDPLLLDFDSETVSRREHIIQQSIAGFDKRLEDAYPEYADIRTALQLALLYLRLGLRLMTHSVSFGSDSTLASMSRIGVALVSFPTVRGTTMLLTNSATNLAQTDITPQYLLLKLAAIGLEKSLGVKTECHIHTVEASYEQVLHLWLIDRARESDQDLASQSLYKRNPLNDSGVSDAEAEEQEFLALFPQFEDVLQRREASSQTKEGNRKILITPSQMLLVAGIHHHLFSPTSHNADSLDAFVTFDELRTSEVDTLFDGCTLSLPDSMDAESRPYQLSLLRNHLSVLQGIRKSPGRPYDFYSDCNVPEIRKASAIIDALGGRLDALLREWPDQAVLQHLKSLCDSMLALDIHSPVAKILSALEQLLMQIEDWEIYANRENTLREHQSAMTGLIMEWRRLELSSWEALLRAQSRLFADGASQWWFRIYDVTIRASLDVLSRVSREEAGDFRGYLNNLIPLLDDFICSSPLGQYHARMGLLQSFASYADQLASSKSLALQHGLKRVGRVLRTTSQYYGIFATPITRYLGEQQGIIENEIRVLIKLASWKDVNVYALKQSARKTHHQLYKSVRKFRDVMRQPLAGWLQAELAGDAELEALPDRSPVSRSRAMPTFPAGRFTVTPSSHLEDLSKIFQKFDKLVNARIRTRITSDPAGKVDDLAIHIISTAKTLSMARISATGSAGKKEKDQKALTVRKRKAWSDLLKELKRVGFKANVKPDILAQLRDVLWLREQPVFSEVPTSLKSIEKSETYFRRLQSALPNLRMLLSDHHPDVSTRDLQRGIMLLESGFALAIDARSWCIEALEGFGRLNRICCRLKMMSSSTEIVSSGSELAGNVTCVKTILVKLVNALDELFRGLEDLREFRLRKTVPAHILDGVQEMIIASRSFHDQVCVLEDHVNLTEFSLLLDKEGALLVSVRQHFQHISSTLRRWAEEELHLQYLLCPVNAWLDAQESPQFCSSPPPPPPLASADNTDTIINTLMLSIQGLVSTCPIDGDEDSSTDDDYFIRDDCRLHHTRTSLLKLGTITDQLNAALPSLSLCPEEILRINLGRLLPFLDRYVELAEDQLSAHSHWVKALFKLLYVLCSVMHTVGKQGFCKPPDSDDSAAGEGGVESGGVGLGEGSGCENVSKEIEEESQVEGLQGETGDAGDAHEERGNDDAIEVDDDFVGDMEDVPDTGSQGVESDEGSQFDPEEQLGTLDPLDPSSLDEKLWGDEEGPAAGGEDEKINQDRSHGNDAKAQMVAKDGKAQTNKENSRDLRGNDGPTPESDDISLPEDNDENDDEHPHADANGAPIDDHVQDADALGLPEDMNLDFETEREDDHNDEAGDDVMDDEPGMDLEEEGDGGPTDGEQAPPDGMRNVQQPPAANDEPADNVQEEDSAALPDTSPGGGFSQANESQDAANDDRPTGDQNISATSSGTPEGGVKESSRKPDGPVQTNTLPDEPQTSGMEAAGSAIEGSQHASGPLPHDQEPSINPLRSLGDALKDVQRRLREVLERADSSETSREQVHDASNVSQVEYAQPDDMDYEMQALAPAGQEQVVRLKDLKIVADDIEGPAPMDVDLPAEAGIPLPHEKPLTITESESIQRQTQDHAEGAVPRPDRYPRHGFEQGSVASDDAGPGAEREDSEVAELEIELRKWQAEGQPSDRTEHMWRLYESLTHHLAYVLCEQLRLILEPTRSTRLRGDYRTGKRLNMKRIIQYIASDYTKDKIWLRRTKPSQREYKVLIALDDSRSMAESHSVHLAYQTLALVSTALSRLEVGDIGIVKFGEAVEVVHGFEDGPFTNRSGSKVIDAFKFDQNATDVLALVETSLGILQSARERGSFGSSSAANLWQLEIIISDGVCQDHDRIRNVLRQAEEERVMVVFIIIDALRSVTRSTTAKSDVNQNSILSMQQAAYKMVDGRMELQMNRYLDSFPFEYYVVLRNVEALPEVLCSTLKQFFERVSEE